MANVRACSKEKHTKDDPGCKFIIISHNSHDRDTHKISISHERHPDDSNFDEEYMCVDCQQFLARYLGITKLPNKKNKDKDSKGDKK